MNLGKIEKLMVWSNISAKEGAQFYYFNDWIFEENFLNENKKLMQIYQNIDQVMEMWANWHRQGLWDVA